MNYLKESAFQLLHNELGDTTIEPIIVMIGTISVIQTIIAKVTHTQLLAIYFDFALLGVFLTLLLVGYFSDRLQKTKGNERDRLFVESLNREINGIGYRAVLNIREIYHSNKISIFNDNLLIKTITLDEEVLKITHFKELMDFPDEDKQYPYFQKCNTVDELENHINIDAEFVRKYIESLTADERIGFFISLGYHTGKWCRTWYNSDPQKDETISLHNPIRLKLIGQHIPV